MMSVFRATRHAPRVQFVLAVLWTKIVKFCGNIGDHSQLINLGFRLSIAGFIPKILRSSRDIVVNPPESRQFWTPGLFGGGEGRDLARLWSLDIQVWLTLNMWQGLDEFCAVNYEVGVRNRAESGAKYGLSYVYAWAVASRPINWAGQSPGAPRF